MCITFLFTNPGDHSSKYKVILINNRDEYYSRATQKATLMSCEGGRQSIYGIDLAGAVKGTWLGLSVAADKSVKIGNLANVTGEELKGKRGRGPIVTNFINGNESIESCNEKLHEISQEFSSFNFLSVEVGSFGMKSFYVSNTPKKFEPVPLGFVGLGNSPMSCPFKKVEIGTEEFEKIVKKSSEITKDELMENLLGLLRSETKYFPDDELTRRRQETAERFSSIKVDLSDEGYGTRTHTVILVDKDNNVDYFEQTMTGLDQNGEWEMTHLTIPEKFYQTTHL